MENFTKLELLMLAEAAKHRAGDCLESIDWDTCPEAERLYREEADQLLALEAKCLKLAASAPVV